MTAPVTAELVALVPMTGSALGVVAHAVHYALLFGGLACVVALLLASRPGPVRRAPISEHEARMVALRAAVDSGQLGGPLDVPEVPRHETATVPGAFCVAVVSSVAAAGVHAAATPAHVGEGLLIGGFFVVSAIAQLVWAVLAMSAGPRPLLLWAAVVGNASIVALWVYTRMVGVPFGLGEREPVGPWDLAAGAWELVTVGACVLLLVHPVVVARRTAMDLHRWPTPARGWLLGSLVVLGALTLAGLPT